LLFGLIPTVISLRTQRRMKNAGVGGAAVSGRLSLAGAEARPTELFPYKVAFIEVRKASIL